MRVCVIGTGYVGLVTGVCLSHIGHHVICVDNNEEKVQLMKSGQSPIYEPGLSDLMKSSMESGNLEFTSDLGAGVGHGEILFIAVGTPALPTGESDTRYVEAVARGIGENLNGGYKVIVNKSTVPIGSGDWVRMIVMDGLAERQGGAEATFDVVSNPEFLREGSAVFDTFNPDRIVLGSNSEKALGMMKDLYQPLVERKFAENQNADPVPVVTTDLNSAEMVKYDVKPEIEAFDLSHIFQAKLMADRGDLAGTPYVQFVMGVKNAMPVDREVFDFYLHTVRRLFGEDAPWCAAGIGSNQIVVNDWAIAAGGHARTGLEDNVRWDRDTLAPSNAALVRRAVEVCEKHERPVATWAEARQILGLREVA